MIEHIYMEIPENLIKKIGKEHFEDDSLQIERPNSENIPIEIKVNKEKLDEEKLDLLQDTSETLQNLGNKFQSVLLNQMQDYADNPKYAFSQEMMERMIEKGYDLPQLKILSDEFAQRFLDETDINTGHPVGDDSLLVIFNLPKPMGRFWYKGGEDYWGDDKEKEEIDRSKNVAWGDFYRKSAPVIWNIDNDMDEKDIKVNRLNLAGQHDPKKYYYIWEVSYWD